MADEDGRAPASAWPRLYPRAGLHGRLVHELGQRIGRGEFRQGEALPPIDELLDRFGVSRTSIREAIRVLAAKGLVELRQRTGGRILPMRHWNLLDPDVLAWIDPFRLDPTLVAELAEVRLAVETHAARVAALRAREQDLDKIEHCLDEMQRRALDSDLGRFYAADLAFHAAVFEGSHNRFLAQLGRALMPALERAFDLHHQTMRFRDPQHLLLVICPMHRAILEGLRQRDPVRSEQAMREVIVNAIEDLGRYQGLGGAPDGPAAQHAVAE